LLTGLDFTAEFTNIRAQLGVQTDRFKN